VEELVRLPCCFLCYTPAQDAPPVEPSPAAAAGFVTFGSFNNLAKITPEVCATDRVLVLCMSRPPQRRYNPAMLAVFIALMYQRGSWDWLSQLRDLHEHKNFSLAMQVLRVWARILRAVPGSRLLLKNKPFACASARAHTSAALAAHGVDSSRVGAICQSLEPLDIGTPIHAGAFCAHSPRYVIVLRRGQELPVSGRRRWKMSSTIEL
jgi:hypothetical protein